MASGTSHLKGPDFLPLPGPDEAPNVTRFAPSPTGYMHLGHAYAALFACEAARRSGGRFLLRLEDIDKQRCRPEFESAIHDDLGWLGLAWDGLRRQAEHLPAHAQALQRLVDMGVAYTCFCTRQQIRAEIEESGRAPHGPSGEPIYPGICRELDPNERAFRIKNGMPYAWRLDVARGMAMTGPLWWHDGREGWVQAEPAHLGDIIIARKDVPTSYHLACTLDDHLQGVTLVTRGEDLFHATHVHRLLQALLNLRVPRWYHHNLVVDGKGQRLAKRNQATTLKHVRDLGRQPADVWRLLGLEPAGGTSAR